MAFKLILYILDEHFSHGVSQRVGLCGWREVCTYVSTCTTPYTVCSVFTRTFLDLPHFQGERKAQRKKSRLSCLRCAASAVSESSTFIHHLYFLGGNRCTSCVYVCGSLHTCMGVHASCSFVSVRVPMVPILLRGWKGGWDASSVSTRAGWFGGLKQIWANVCMNRLIRRSCGEVAVCSHT